MRVAYVASFPLREMSILPGTLLASLGNALPAYGSSIAQLDLVCRASHHASSLFVHAPNNQELVSAIVQDRLERSQPSYDRQSPTLQDVLPKIIMVDLQELRSPRVLYDRVLNLFAAWDTEVGWSSDHVSVENWNGRQTGASIERTTVEDGGPTSAEREWNVVWNNATMQEDRTGAQAIRTNESLDGFYQGLRDIFTIGDDDGSPNSRPQRRYVVVQNANLLEELASVGSHQGAPKETGIGMTFAGALLQLELVVSRLSLPLQRRANDETGSHPDYGHSHFDFELDENARRDGWPQGSRDHLVCTASWSDRSVALLAPYYLFCFHSIFGRPPISASFLLPIDLCLTPLPYRLSRLLARPPQKRTQYSFCSPSRSTFAPPSIELAPHPQDRHREHIADLLVRNDRHHQHPRRQIRRNPPRASPTLLRSRFATPRYVRLASWRSC